MILKYLTEELHGDGMIYVGGNEVYDLYKIISLDGFSNFHNEGIEDIAEQYGFSTNNWNTYCSDEARFKQIPYVLTYLGQSSVVGMFLTTNSLQGYEVNDISNAFKMKAIYEDISGNNSLGSLLNATDLSIRKVPLYLIKEAFPEDYVFNGLSFSDNGVFNGYICGLRNPEVEVPYSNGVLTLPESCRSLGPGCINFDLTDLVMENERLFVVLPDSCVVDTDNDLINTQYFNDGSVCFAYTCSEDDVADHGNIHGDGSYCVEFDFGLSNEEVRQREEERVKAAMRGRAGEASEYIREIGEVALTKQFLYNLNRAKDAIVGLDDYGKEYLNTNYEDNLNKLTELEQQYNDLYNERNASRISARESGRIKVLNGIS